MGPSRAHQVPDASASKAADCNNTVKAPVIRGALEPLTLSTQLRWTCQSG
jgi:hypothetical protein